MTGVAASPARPDQRYSAKRPLVGGRPGDDQPGRADALDAADAALSEVEFDRGGEAGTAAGDDFARVEERDDQRPLLRQRVAQPDQQRAVGRRGQPFDVEAAVGLGGETRRVVQPVGFERIGPGHVAQQMDVGLPDRLERRRITGQHLGGEEPVPVRLGLALAVAAMRGDPVDSRADRRGAFDVCLLAGSGGEEGRQVQRTNRLRLPLPVDTERVVLVVADDEVGGIERDGRRGIARPAVGSILLRAGKRRQGGGEQGRKGGLCECFQVESPLS